MVKALTHLVLISVILLNVACSRTEKPAPVASRDTNPSQQEPSVSPRDILSKQPDFVAEEFYSSFERLHGHSFVNKVAKKGEYYRREGPIMVFFDKVGEPTLRYWRPAKMFIDEPPAKLPPAWYEKASNAEILAQAAGIRFEVLGTEEVEGHECLKIRAWSESEAQAEEKDRAIVFLYAAKDLQNLVIMTELILPDRKSTHVLKNISFEVPDDLFKVLAHHRRQTSHNGMHPTRDTNLLMYNWRGRRAGGAGR